MSSKSLDLAKLSKEELGEKLSEAMNANDEKAAAQAMTEFADMIQQSILEEAASAAAEQAADRNVLAARGCRVLTSAENKYYGKLIEAMKEKDLKMALTNMEIAMPETVIDSVFEDIVQEHPLLKALDFRNTNGSIRMIVNKGGIQLAQWGPLDGEFKKELSGSIEEIKTGMHKLQAFIPVANSMLDLGPVWLDRYIRAILSEAIAFGAEKGYISGTGKNEPIGMDRIVGSGSVVTDGVYSRKTAIKVTSFDTVTYGELCSKLAVNAESGRRRIVSGLILVVNPVDYFKKIVPATTILTPSGMYARDVLPVPTAIIQSQQITEGEAILGMGKRYFAPLGTAQGGKIEYDDSVQFMEDNRVYAARLYGTGKPLDNNSFLLLDISELRPMRYAVSTYTESLDAGSGSEDSETAETE